MFSFKRYNYDNNKILTSKDLSFLLIISLVIIIQSFKFIIRNESNEDNFDINYSKIENKKQLHYCISAIKNRILISLNIISKHNHNQQAFASNDKSINKHFASQSLSTKFESTIVFD